MNLNDQNKVKWRIFPEYIKPRRVFRSENKTNF